MVTSGTPRMLSPLRRKLLRELWRLRGQVASVAAVVACGVMVVVAMTGTLRSVERAVDRYYASFRFADVFARATRVPAHVADHLATIPGVAAVEPRVVLSVALDVPGLALPASGRLVSLPEQGTRGLNGVHLLRGRLPGARSSDEVVVSEGFATANAIELDDRLGAVLEGRWRRLRVVGIGASPEFVWELSGAGSFTTDQRAFGVLWMPREAVEAAAGMHGSFNDVSITLVSGASLPAVLAEVDSSLVRYGGLGAVGRDRQPSHRVLESEFRSLRVFGVVFPLIFLAVAGFLLNVVLARLIATQRGEIGTLKAFGYTDLEVGTHFAAFAAATVAIGAAVGLGAGTWLGAIYTGVYVQHLRVPGLGFAIHPLSAAAGIGMSTVAGLTGALMAVRGAVRLAPASALRPESPERYRPLLLERLGLGGMISPAARMVLRHMERRPMRALSTVIGVALALALLAGTMSLFDGVFRLADVQFRLVQREDLSVSFDRARPASAASELARISGVISVETFRMAPVRVSHGSVTRTVAVIGSSGDATLRNVVGSDGTAYRIPPTGALLTRGLAEQLGMGRGDTLRLELVELGGQPRDVVVVGLTDELIGASIYMEARALDRMLGDEPRVSGALLRMDPAAEASVLARLKAIPAVTGAASREAIVAAWDRQVLSSIRVSGTLVVTCAVIIALGTIYNGARIGLSERGRELASLRVLGFRRGEVAALLFGEQGALTLAAIPLGLALGAALTFLIASLFEAEDQRFPVVLEPRTYVGSILAVLAAAVIAGLFIRRRLDRMDLIAVLKTRE